jgi:hypothetical protein
MKANTSRSTLDRRMSEKTIETKLRAAIKLVGANSHVHGVRESRRPRRYRFGGSARR